MQIFIDSPHCTQDIKIQMDAICIFLKCLVGNIENFIFPLMWQNVQRLQTSVRADGIWKNWKGANINVVGIILPLGRDINIECSKQII